VKQALQQHLERNGIQTRNYFAGNLLLHPAYRGLGDPKAYPNAYDVLKHVFFMGTSPAISKENLEYIEKTIQDFKKEFPLGADGYSIRFMPQAN
jgi:CDP-6-deoxy-D-xylo-4-hexulose-3-dehydrase